MRALVVSNMLPDAAHPERGRFVRDQVDALRRLAGQEAAGHEWEVELYEFPPGARALAAAARELHGRYGSKARPPEPLDVVHAHFGLTAWPALAVRARVRGLTVHGTDVRHPRTRLATGAALPLMDLVAAPTAELARELPTRTARERALVLPCGVDMERFRPLPALKPAPSWASARRAHTCCSRPTPRARASATTARSRSHGRSRSRFTPSAGSLPSRCRRG